MQLQGSDGAEIVLRAVRYQFPGTRSSGAGWDWDANWLVIRGDVKTGDGHVWSFEDPSLTTLEARELGAWLRAVVKGAVHPSPFGSGNDEPAIFFTEPNIALSLEGRSQERARVRVHLSLEALPPSFHETIRPDIFSFFLVLDLGLDDLSRAVDEWNEELGPFPER